MGLVRWPRRVKKNTKAARNTAHKPKRRKHRDRSEQRSGSGLRCKWNTDATGSG